MYKIPKKDQKNIINEELEFVQTNKFKEHQRMKFIEKIKRVFDKKVLVLFIKVNMLISKTINIVGMWE